MKKLIALTLAAAQFAVLCCACGGTAAASQPAAQPAEAAEPVTMTVCGPWTDCKAVENAAQAFNAQYPNCDIQYEFLQNYEESLETRLKTAPDSLDLFLTDNLQADSTLTKYAMDLITCEELDLSATNPALIKNFTLLGGEPGKAPLYAIPLGGEMRGMYVNKTLLASVGLTVPTNATELLAACQVLKEAGYVPLHGNPGYCPQRLLYPWVCNLIANAPDYQATYDAVNTIQPGISEYFREPMQMMYTLMSNYYYDYKYVETEMNMFIDNSDEGVAQYFFNILDNGSGLAKVDDVGQVAFMAGTLSQTTVMERIREDYHSAIDYEFVLAPVAEEGGFAYSSPAKGIAMNKNSANTEWAVKFLNYLFSEEGNTKFAQDINYIPNTADSFDFVKETFDVPDDHISDLGQVTFDYPFYSIMEAALVSVAKGNNPKYMDTAADGSTKLYDFEYYMEQLEAAFAEQRESGAK